MYRSRLRHYKALTSSERPLRRGSESPSETTDVETKAGAGLGASSSDGVDAGSTNSSPSSTSSSCSSDDDADSIHSESSPCVDDANSEESDFSDDDPWTQYDEIEELDAEARFREFEEMLDAKSDVGMGKGNIFTAIT